LSVSLNEQPGGERLLGKIVHGISRDIERFQPDPALYVIGSAQSEIRPDQPSATAARCNVHLVNAGA
jgi:hypothetical protein